MMQYAIQGIDSCYDHRKLTNALTELLCLVQALTSAFQTAYEPIEAQLPKVVDVNLNIVDQFKATFA